MLSIAQIDLTLTFQIVAEKLEHGFVDSLSYIFVVLHVCLGTCHSQGRFLFR